MCRISLDQILRSKSQGNQFKDDWFIIMILLTVLVVAL